MKDFIEQMTEMYTKAGFTDIKTTDSKQAPGLDIHEMGGVRMGNDPKTSLLNKWNQLHACPNVFVTDGACMTSTSTQNPSLTYMAFTARAANHAMEEMKKGRFIKYPVSLLSGITFSFKDIGCGNDVYKTFYSSYSDSCEVVLM